MNTYSEMRQMKHRRLTFALCPLAATLLLSSCANKPVKNDTVALNNLPAVLQAHSSAAPGMLSSGLPKIDPTVLAKRKPAFVSKKATEANLSFSHLVTINSKRKPRNEVALQQVEKQIQHLFGPMERNETSGVPKEDHKIKVTSIKEGKEAGTFEIYYNYNGTAVIENGPRKYIDVLLPKNPDTVFSSGMDGEMNLCTDEHYQSEDDFWYFWSPAPEYPKCKLKEGVDFDKVRATFERIRPEFKSTYPEYNRLAKNGVIEAHILIGLDEPENGHNPNSSRDLNATTYLKMRQQLEKMGYQTKTWDPIEIGKILPKTDRQSLPFVEELSKTFPEKNLTIKVRLFFGEAGIDEASRPFHFFYRDALENAALMIYDGHSGLGGHLDLDAIQKVRRFKITPNKSQYQIYFFNSCTSYTYYNSLYFQKKRKRNKVDAKGTKNLDVLANGLSTAFDSMADGDMALLKAVDLWAEKGKWTSYQSIARSIDSDNLFTVNGDEDNPHKPVRD